MFQEFFRAICQVGIFMICSQVILHFRPNKDYEKYMRVLVGAMVLLQIFLPMVRLFNGDGISGLEGSINKFAQEIEASRREAEASGVEADHILEKMTLEQVRKALAQRQEQEEENQQGQQSAVQEQQETVQEKQGQLQEQQNQQETVQGMQGQQETEVERSVVIDPIEVTIGGE